MMEKYYNSNKKTEKPGKNYKQIEEDDIEKKLFFWRIIINVVLSLILVIVFFIIWNTYTSWKLFFFIVIWSFWSNTFYIISITIIDICIYTKKNKCEKLNNWVRNYFLRIFFPFSIGTVVIFWELTLLGNIYIDIEYSLIELMKCFFINGLVLIFILFDIFTSRHINKNDNYLWDLLIITGIVFLHFLIVILCKEFLNVYQWNFLMIADFRQIIASFIIIYIIILNGYVIIYIISDNFFLNEKEEKNKDKNINENNVLEIKEEEFDEKKEYEEKEKESNNGESINESEDKKEKKGDNFKNKDDNGINGIKDKNKNFEIIINKNKNKFINKKKYHIEIPKKDNINIQDKKI